MCKANIFWGIIKVIKLFINKTIGVNWVKSVSYEMVRSKGNIIEKISLYRSG